MVIVLSQLDDRYFRGLEGPYRFNLAMRLHKTGQEDYFVRSEQQIRTERSTNVELDLEEGEYDVRIKIDADRDDDVLAAEQVIRENGKKRRDKLMRIGLAYDLAHSKGKIVETEQEKASREAHEAQKKAKAFDKIKKQMMESRDDSHYLRVMEHAKAKLKASKARQKAKARAQGKAQAKAARKARENPQDKADSDSKDSDQEHPQESEESDSDQEDDISSVGSLSDIGERETKLRVKSYKEENYIRDSSDDESDASDLFADEDAETAKNLWNPIVVIGLRVYHKTADAGAGVAPGNAAVSLRVIRRDPYATSKEDADAKTKVLDVDDSARDVLIAADAKDDDSVENLGEHLHKGLRV